MDELIGQLENLTADLMNRLNITSYEEMVRFVESRQLLVNELEDILKLSAADAGQTDRIRNLIGNDTAIISRMNFLKAEAADWLQQRNMAKVQRNVYETAYSPDAILMDRRK
ncbi:MULTISPECIES: hypothetical protein [Paenibacillus]|jgi:hypothetical protein|uniref:Flagellar protein FliT n=1 Tax=Paenibacillus peoriae TaxID=59893 RepID=A0A7H0Y7P1_9BACL|nr:MULTISPECIES: hypothetical protein [Paenibacillus]KOS03797.1 hypothetical protein AM598_04615 [Paenibacillus polymyxa]QNR67099.1 hypothetical protein IAQ67_25630 [Paenibacillus peoriae]WDM21635.1 hypothetical protein J4I02_22395 [Paenibacillus polymyxa]